MYDAIILTPLEFSFGEVPPSSIQFKEIESQSLLPSGHNHLGVANTVLALSVELHSQLFDHSIVVTAKPSAT